MPFEGSIFDFTSVVEARRAAARAAKAAVKQSEPPAPAPDDAEPLDATADGAAPAEEEEEEEEPDLDAGAVLTLMPIKDAKVQRSFYAAFEKEPRTFWKVTCKAVSSFCSADP